MRGCRRDLREVPLAISFEKHVVLGFEAALRVEGLRSLARKARFRLGGKRKRKDLVAMEPGLREGELAERLV